MQQGGSYSAYECTQCDVAGSWPAIAYLQHAAMSMRMTCACSYIIYVSKGTISFGIKQGFVLFFFSFPSLRINNNKSPTILNEHQSLSEKFGFVFILFNIMTQFHSIINFKFNKSGTVSLGHIIVRKHC